MEKIINQEFGGERPLYCRHDLYLENVKIHAGESALKETGNITAVMDGDLDGFINEYLKKKSQGTLEK